MDMLKKSLCILLVCCVGLYVLCGCNTQPEIPTGSNHNEAFLDDSLCAESSGNKMVETEDGYYYLRYSTLYYADKDSLGQWVPVCNEPNCKHTTAACPAKVEGDTFFIQDDRIYTMRDPRAVTGSSAGTSLTNAVYSISRDGTGLQQEYGISGSDLEHGGAGYFFLRAGKTYGCYSVMQQDGTFQNQIICADGTQEQVLYSGTSMEMMAPDLTPASADGMHGDLAVYCSFLSPSGEYYDHLYRFADNTLTEIPGITDYNIMGAYLDGDILYHFVPNDGYYRTDLSTNITEKQQDAQLSDSVAFHMSQRYCVETNIYRCPVSQVPEIRIYDGNSWKNADLNGFDGAAENGTFFPFAISSEHIFFVLSQRTSTRLYCICLTDETYTLTPCGEFELPQ